MEHADGGRREQRDEDEAGESGVLEGEGVASGGSGTAGALAEVASYELCPPPLGLQNDEDLQALLKGTQLLKVKSNSWRRERFYKLQEDCKTIWQESRKVMRSPESQLCECPGLGALMGWAWRDRVNRGGTEIRAWMGHGWLGLEVPQGPGPQTEKLSPSLVGHRSVMQPGPDRGTWQLARVWGSRQGKRSSGLGWKKRSWTQDYRWRC